MIEKFSTATSGGSECCVVRYTYDPATGTVQKQYDDEPAFVHQCAVTPAHWAHFKRSGWREHPDYQWRWNDRADEPPAPP